MKKNLRLLLGLLPVIAQAQAPIVQQLNPARNAVAAQPSTPVSVRLSQPVGAGANTLRVFSSQRGGRLAGQTTVVGNVLTFNPSQSFQPGEKVSVTVPTTVQSSAGFALAAPHVFQFTAAAIGGTGTFMPGPAVPVGSSYPQRVVMADVDNDGDMDMLVSVSNYNPGTVSVRLNNGSGNFTPGTNVSVGNFTDLLLAADVDGDGDLDMVSSSFNAVAIRLNNGNGVFSGGSDVLVGSSSAGMVINNMVAGDIDGDGDLDLLLNSATITPLLNNGTGSFNVGPAAGTSGQALMALGDVDNDGDLDLLAEAIHSFGNYLISLRLNNGNGTFGAATQIPVAGMHSSATLADIDNDGDLDLLAAGGTNTSIRLNNGTGIFSGTGMALTGTGVQKLSMADLDADGDLDLFTANYTAGTVDIRFNNGAGVFTGSGSFSVANSLTDATAADIDSDGDLDITAVAASSTDARIFLNQNSSLFTTTGLAPARNLRNAPRNSNVVANFNLPVNNTPASASALKVFSSQRGGLLAGTTTVAGSSLSFDPTSDFRPGERISVSVTKAARSGTLLLDKPEVYQFTTAVSGGVGTFAGASLLSTFSFFPFAVLAADMDNDGDLDALSLSQNINGGSAVSIQSNNGNGTFVTGGAASGGNYPTGLAVADVDGDGDLDVLTSYGDGSSFNPGTVGIQLNNGSGSFSTGSSVRVGSFTLGLTTGDVDGDGDQDVVAINGGGLAGVCLNSGNGTFGSAVNVTLGGAVYNILLADIDSDGDLDLLTALGSRVGIHLNNGLGTFGVGTLVSMSSAKALTTADVDGDGDLDLLSTNGLTADVRLNNGSGVFSSGSTVAVASGGDGTLFSIASGDIDGDGDLDMVTGGGSFSGIMSVRLNDGTGLFGGGYDPVVVPGIAPMPAATTLADLDGDGDLDWLVARYNAGGLRVLFNQVTPIIGSVMPTAGVIGGTVTVTGANFTGATSVTLNGVPITAFTVVNATTITFTLPPGVSSGPIVIITPIGTATSTPYSVLPPPIISRFAPASGGVGLPVVLTGANFTGATAVTVGGTAAVFTVASATSITLTVPAAAVTGPIAVTTSGGTSTSGTNFTVTVPPTITGFTPATAASGTLVTVSGTNLASATALSIAGIPIAGFTVLNASTISFVLPSGAISGQIAVTTTGGVATSAATFTVVPMPTLSFLIPAAQVAGGAALSLTLVGTGFTPASTVSFDGVTYTQTNSTFNTLDVIIPAAVLATAGTRAVTVTNLAGSSNAFSFIVSRPSTSGAYEDFEAGTKYSYPTGNVSFSSGSWTFSEAMVGTTADDKFNGIHAARLQAGSIAMNFDKPNGAGIVTVYAALYGSDTGASFLFEKSTDGGVTYTPVPGAPAVLTATLTPYYFTVNQTGNVRFRISSTSTSIGSGPRVMLDDLSITDYIITSNKGNAAYSGLTVFPNPTSEQLTIHHPVIALAGAKAELWNLTGRVVRTVVLPASGQFRVDGLPAGVYLLRVAGLTQRISLL